MLHSQVLVDCRIAVARHQGNHRAEGQQAGWDVVQDPVFVAAAAESHAGQRGVERRGAGRGLPARLLLALFGRMQPRCQQ